MTQRWVVIAGSFLILLGLVASYASVDYLRTYSVDESLATQNPTANPDKIEVIQVGQSPVTADSAKTPAAKATSKTEVPLPAKALPDSVVKISFPGAKEIRTNVPSFRGPFGNGVFFQKGTVVEWDAASGKNVIWKSAVPKKGYNSPIIWEISCFSPERIINRVKSIVLI